LYDNKTISAGFIVQKRRGREMKENDGGGSNQGMSTR
jgi:hypothetical protein